MRVLFMVVAAFVFGAGGVAALMLAVKNLPAYLTRRRIEQRMHEATFGEAAVTPDGEPTVVKSGHDGPLQGVDRMLAGTRSGNILSRLIEQSGSKTSVSVIVIASVVTAAVLAMAVAVIARSVWAPTIAALIGLLIPVAVLRSRRKKRMKKFEEMFPDALDLVARALRAGHAFSTAMGMVASESPAPVGPEFRKTYDEQNFGLPLKEALNNLASRVPLLDVRFFVTAVLIQRDTGGNLAEILENLAYVVRERFKIQRQVRVYTAHGRFTGWVLMALPAGLAVFLMIVNPEHMGLLFKEKLGQAMLTVAIVMQIIGYLWIKWVIKIEV